MVAKTCKGKPAVNKKGWRRSVLALSHHVLGEYNQLKNELIALPLAPLYADVRAYC